MCYHSSQTCYPRKMIYFELIRHGVTYYARYFVTPDNCSQGNYAGDSASCYVETPSREVLE